MAEIPASTLGISDSLGPAGFCSVYLLWCPLCFRVGNVSLPGAFLPLHPPGPHFPGLSSVWIPGTADISLGQGLRLPIPPSSLHPLPCLRGPGIHSATECGTRRTGSRPTPACFRGGTRGPETDLVSQDHRLQGGSWTTLDTGARPAISAFHHTGQPAQSLCREVHPQVTFASFIISSYLFNIRHLLDIKHLTRVITFNPHNNLMIYLLVLPLSLLFSVFRWEN